MPLRPSTNMLQWQLQCMTSCHLRWVADRLGSARGRGSSGMPFPRSAPVLRSVLLYSREKRGRGGRGYRTTERAVSMPRSTEGKKPRKTPESSTLRWEIGYGSGYGHIRQPQAADEPAATSYCLQHHRQPLDSLVSSCSWMPWACSRLLLQGGNRVLRGRI